MSASRSPQQEGALLHPFEVETLVRIEVEDHAVGLLDIVD